MTACNLNNVIFKVKILNLETFYNVVFLFGKGAGYAIIVVNIICTTYYSVILTYPIIFIWKSFSTTLPWANCKNPWNTDNCLQVILYENYLKEKKNFIITNYYCLVN